MSEDDSSIVSFTSLKNTHDNSSEKGIKDKDSYSFAAEKFTKILGEAFGTLNAENGSIVSREANKIKSLAWLATHAARNRPTSNDRAAEYLDSLRSAFEIANESATKILEVVHGGRDDS